MAGDVPSLIVTVYSKPDCVQCKATERWLTKHKIPFIKADLLAHPEIADEAKKAGAFSAPVVVLEDGDKKIMWGGFNPGHLKGFLKRGTTD